MFALFFMYFLGKLNTLKEEVIWRPGLHMMQWLLLWYEPVWFQSPAQ